MIAQVLRICGLSVDVSALKIHMSENAHNAITAFPEFITEFRGDICVKVNARLFRVKNHVFVAQSFSFLHFVLKTTPK